MGSTLAGLIGDVFDREVVGNDPADPAVGDDVSFGINENDDVVFGKVIHRDVTDGRQLCFSMHFHNLADVRVGIDALVVLLNGSHGRR